MSETCEERRISHYEERLEAIERQSRERLRRCRQRPWWDPRRLACVIRHIIRTFVEWITTLIEVWEEYRECERMGYDYCLEGVTSGDEYETIYNDHSEYFLRKGIRDQTKCPEHCLAVKFLGTNSLYITDGRSHILIDPFFSRPDVNPLAMRFTEVWPLSHVISQTLEHAHIERVDAIVLTHAHYDHAMDIAEVAKTIESRQNHPPKILGCRSIAHIARGGGISPHHIQVIGENVTIPGPGEFTLTFLPAAHIFIPEPGLNGEISSDLFPPVPAIDYKLGQIHAIHIGHPFCSLLNLGSAASKNNTLQNIHADFLLMGIGGFDTLMPPTKRSVYDETVGFVNPRQILFTHWDNFRKRLDQPPEFFRPVSLISDPRISVNYFRSRGNQPVHFMRIWDCVFLKRDN